MLKFIVVMIVMIALDWSDANIMGTPHWTGYQFVVVASLMYLLMAVKEKS